MPQTQARRQPTPVSGQYATHLRQSAIRIEAMARQVLIDHASGRLVRDLGRKLHAEALALNEAMTALGLAEEMAAREAPKAA